MTEQPTIVPAEVGDAGEILTVQRAAYLTEAQRYADPFLPPLTVGYRPDPNGHRLAVLAKPLVSSARSDV